MRASDLLARAAAALMVVAAAWNVYSSALLIAALIWLVVGALWLVPLAFGLVELALALVFLAAGPRRGMVVGPVLGLVVACCNLNPLGIALELVVLGIVLGSRVARSVEGPRVLEARWT